jgi:hypothetical protein
MLVLSAAACSNDGTPEDSGGATGPEVNAPFRLRDGALLGVMLTADPVEDGLADPRLVFTTDDTQVTALVVLGDDIEQGAMLSIVWSSLVGIDDGEVLFTHDVAVGPGGEAFSVGVAETGLAPGRYEVVATLGDAEVRLPWRAEIALEGTQAGKARMASALAQVGDEDWNVPDSGSSGWYDPTPESPPAEPGPCEIVSLNPGFDPMRTVDARVGWIGTCSEMKLEAAVTGSPTTVASLTGAPTLPQLHGRVDLCALPGGSDLPGTVVRWTATGSEGTTASVALTVPDFGGALMVDMASVPEPGRVDPGQRIALRGMAIVPPTSLGIRELVLTVNGQELQRVGNLSETSSPEPCDDGRLGAITYTHYDVPQDAPSEIEICAHAVGFDGTEAEHCIKFFTGEVWEGSANITSSAVYPEGSGSCQDGWELDFTFGVSDEGTIEGQGKADLTSGPTCPFPVGPSYELYEYRVLGEETVGGFSIRFALETFGPAGGAEYAGFVSMFGFPAPPSGGPPVSVAVSGTSGTGQGSWRFESGNPPATYSAKGKITIECVASCEESAG